MENIPEDEVQNSGRLLASKKYKCCLFRNNCGLGLTLDGKRKIRFGLIEGSGDTIGFREVLITPEMVGLTIAQFVSIEFKRSNWKMPKKPDKKLQDQIDWRNNVLAHGGCAGFATCNGDVEKILATVV